MTAGLPGTGIGGVFYLISALLMPVNELVLTLRGRSSLARWRQVLRQLTMSAAIVGGMWLIGVLAGLVFTQFSAAVPDAPMARELHTHIVATAFRVNIFHVTPLLMSMATLASILAFTNMLRLFFRPLASET